MLAVCLMRAHLFIIGLLVETFCGFQPTSVRTRRQTGLGCALKFARLKMNRSRKFDVFSRRLLGRRPPGDSHYQRCFADSYLFGANFETHLNSVCTRRPLGRVCIATQCEDTGPARAPSGRCRPAFAGESVRRDVLMRSSANAFDYSFRSQSENLASYTLDGIGIRH